LNGFEIEKFRNFTRNKILMKKIVLVCITAFFSAWVMGQTTKQIGSSTANSEEPPFGIYWGHERSAALYLHTDIGNGSNTISIISLKWQVATTNPNCYNTKIYLKTQSGTSLGAMAWETMVNGATLVYDGSAYFPVADWTAFDIADYVYSLSNLIVLSETNWGGIGASATPKFYWSNAASKNEWWYYDDLASVNDVVNGNRPNIQIIYNTLSGVIPPSAFMAIPISSSEISLNWTRNTANDNVMVAYNTVNTFGTPSGTYIAGNSITGGGTVLYNGSAASFAHTGLSPNTTYYYMAWSVHPSVPTYSVGTNTVATTFCGNTSMYPNITDFETAAFPPSCWSLNFVPWVRYAYASAYGTGTGSAMADFYHLTNGNVLELISPSLDLSSMPFPLVKFDHAYATNTVQVDSLQLWASSDSGATYNLLTNWAGGPNGPLNTGGTSAGLFVPANSQWATKKVALPPGTNRIKFRGISQYGNNLYLDNITIYDTACVTASIPYCEMFDHFTAPTTGCVKVSDDNGDTFKWGTSGSWPRSAPNSMYINHAVSVMNDWFFTPALSLTGGQTYAVNFYYRSGASPSVEALEVKFGTGQSSGGMTGGQIWNNTSVQTTTFLQGSATFTPSGTGTYYVGWHGYSAANMSWLCIDDIHIDIASVTWNGSVSENWNNPLNWTPNLVPNEYQSVTIPSGTDHDPVVYDAGLACKLLTINNGVTMTLNAGSGLTINGNLTIQQNAMLTTDGLITITGNLVIQP
jgi:hypothetical protein